jgi:hypothetical protein
VIGAVIDDLIDVIIFAVFDTVIDSVYCRQVIHRMNGMNRPAEPENN